MSRTGPGRRSGRRSAASPAVAAAIVAVGMYEAAAPLVPPGPGERRQAGERAVGDRGAEVALRADAEPQQRGLGRRELAPDPGDRLRRHAAQLRAALDRICLEASEQLLVARRVGPAPGVVLQAGVDDRAHHPQPERGVRARARPQVLVGHARGAAAERVDHHELRAGAAGGQDLPPQVRRGRHRVPAPAEDVARRRPALGIDLGRDAVRERHPGAAGARADRADEVARPERVEEPGAHRVVLQQPHRAHVEVRQHRLAAVGRDRVAQAPGDQVERLVPARRAERCPRPSARRGSAARAGGRRRTRGRGSSTPSRTGTRP